jgi:putative ABC transport system permease protein
VTRLWLWGLIRRRRGRMVALAAAISIAVSLLASIGAFVAYAQATMTRRAAGSIGVDWQVEVQGGADPANVQATVRSQPGVLRTRLVGFAQTTGLEATTGGTTQTTGPGVLLGLPPDYAATFPGTVRVLAGGGTDGALVAQQTAANLHVAPGDTVVIGRQGLPPASVKVAAIVDLSQSDSLFQKVGAAPGSQPTATPDNVVALDPRQWHALTDPLARTRPDLVTTQVHVKLNHALAHDPGSAYADVLGRANNLEVKLAGAGRVGDNLASTLDAARSDAVYAQFLFLFLGLPGVVLAGLLTVTVANASATRRRSDAALLRTRGATLAMLVRLAAAEAALVSLVGAAAGIGIALVLGTRVFHDGALDAGTPSAVGWAVASALVAVVIAVVSVVIPALHDARSSTVAAARQTMTSPRRALWLRLGLDFWLVGAGIVAFWLSGRNGYQLVLAPEGVPSISVNYWPFAAPALIWIGAALTGWRFADWLLRRGRSGVALALRPLSGALADTVAASMQRQRGLLARSVVLVALAISFAASSAVFNATYGQQARVDALLTNGADVTVTEPAAAGVSPAFAQHLKEIRGVSTVEPLQHRYAYVGADLQDLFGVDPHTIIGATKLQDGYFQGGSARRLIGALAQRPDNILVSAETVRDFQLRPGDELHLRLRQARTLHLIPVTFHYAGIAKEFPTAPRDSFLVANRDYIAAQTGSNDVGAFLLSTTGDRATVANRVRGLVGTSATVTNLDTTRAIVGSSLTAIDLSGLTHVELGYAIVLVVAMAGLVLWLGFAERRRTFAIAGALGASPRQVGAFVWGEAIFIALGGLLLGAIGGWILSHVIVKVLTGVFDPPPDVLAVPWIYLALTVAVSLGATAAATATTVLRTRTVDVGLLRDV